MDLVAMPFHFLAELSHWQMFTMLCAANVFTKPRSITKPRGPRSWNNGESSSILTSSTRSARSPTTSSAAAPAIADLHTEYVEKGGRFYACPVCVKTRGMEDAVWTKGAEVKGAPSVYEFTDGGALIFNY